MTWEKYSFNSHIRVRLKHAARVILLRHHLEERLRLLLRVGDSDAEYRLVLHQQHPQSHEGWFSFQMHRFIEIFGPSMSGDHPLLQEMLFDDIEILNENWTA